MGGHEQADSDAALAEDRHPRGALKGVRNEP